MAKNMLTIDLTSIPSSELEGMVRDINDELNRREQLARMQGPTSEEVAAYWSPIKRWSPDRGDYTEMPVVGRGNMIAAIKLVRQRVPGLKEAKDLVESWRDGGLFGTGPEGA